MNDDNLYGIGVNDATHKGSKKLAIVDCNSLLYSSFFGLKKYRDEKGAEIDSPGVNGLLRRISFYAKEHLPEKIVFVFDTKSASTKKKNEIFGYKNFRQSSPYEIAIELENLRMFLVNSGFDVYESDSVEGDEIIGYFINTYRQNYNQIHILSEDKDMYQFIDKNVSVWSCRLLDLDYLNRKFKAEWISGLGYLLYKALVGDKSDNVSGIDILYSDAVSVSMAKEKRIISQNDLIFKNGISEIDKILSIQRKFADIHFKPDDFVLLDKKYIKQKQDSDGILGALFEMERMFMSAAENIAFSDKTEDSVDILNGLKGGKENNCIDCNSKSLSENNTIDNNYFKKAIECKSLKGEICDFKCKKGCSEGKIFNDINKDLLIIDSEDDNNDNFEVVKDMNSKFLWKGISNEQIRTINKGIEIMNISYGLKRKKKEDIAKLKVRADKGIDFRVSSEKIAKDIGIIWFNFEGFIKYIKIHPLIKSHFLKK